MIEVGPGPGTLTAALLPHVGRLVAIELDDTLADMLARHFQACTQFHLIHGDACTLRPPRPWPRLAASPLFFRRQCALLHHLGAAATLSGGRACAHPLGADPATGCGPPHRGRAAANELAGGFGAGVRSAPHRTPTRPGQLYPPPKVTSAVLRLDARPEPCDRPHERERFFAVVRAGFGQKRKTLRNSLSAGLGLPADQIESALISWESSHANAPRIEITQWLALAAALADEG